MQAKNVFPQLLLVRLLFSVGGAATSTMVTAILPSLVTAGRYQGATESTIRPLPSNGHEPSISSELTVTPKRLQDRIDMPHSHSHSSPAQVAGVVGIFTGCGALLALGFFLRLPELIQQTGIDPRQALADSYYCVGTLSLIVSSVCYIGLRRLSGEEGKGWRALIHGAAMEKPSGSSRSTPSSWASLSESLTMGFRNPLLGLGYLGGFVARASSVGLSLFVPLFVNAYYISTGRCNEAGQSPQAVKESCRGAYVLAAELTGTSQLVALICAPAFGFLADRYCRFNKALLFSAFLGVLGYVALAILKSPETKGKEGNPFIFVIMVLLGISQIGAIVCSLSIVGRCVLGMEVEEPSPEVINARTSATPADQIITRREDTYISDVVHQELGAEYTEGTPLLSPISSSKNHLKGSIAGVYSLTGGAGILVLTKAGGLLFDKVSPVAPFYMLAVFNGVLLVSGIVLESAHIGKR